MTNNSDKGRSTNNSVEGDEVRGNAIPLSLTRPDSYRDRGVGHGCGMSNEVSHPNPRPRITDNY
jgi:hypothetical protein